jgi:hydroxypyruvate reductase
VARALHDPPPILHTARAVALVAAGKAAGAMASSFLSHASVGVAAGLVVGSAPDGELPRTIRVQRGAHPVPDDSSEAAGRRALSLARDGPADALVVLLSGGASSMLAVPAGGLTLAGKQETTRVLLQSAADIHDINCVRKHLSAIKGGRLRAASVRPVVTMAISDVVGDDMSVIGSGPTVADATTYADALAIVERCGIGAFRDDVVSHLRRGARGEIAETPKDRDFDPMAAHASVIGAAADALEFGRDAAVRLGYAVVILDRPVIGEARRIADDYVTDLAALALGHGRPLCMLSSGETTVHVTGAGRGGRNQELALAASLRLERIGRPVVVASVGSDGVDGPTDAAGAMVDSTTVARARQRGLEPMQYLDDNDAWTFFESLGDLVRTGVTGTNVGDLQVALVAPLDMEGPSGSEAL